jgi:hypothetical protein
LRAFRDLRDGLKPVVTAGILIVRDARIPAATLHDKTASDGGYRGRNPSPPEEVVPRRAIVMGKYHPARRRQAFRDL